MYLITKILSSLIHNNIIVVIKLFKLIGILLVCFGHKLFIITKNSKISFIHYT